ncbi:hypothetical protein GQ600_25491 [Phytophthora cactorum]|nr:hypothetical protein GQ600_25491 [Phytophthora cactorum]
MSAYTLIPEEVQLYNKTYVALITGTHGKSRTREASTSKLKKDRLYVDSLTSSFTHRIYLFICALFVLDNACAQETGNWEVRKTKQVTATTTLSAAKPIRRWMCLVTTTGRQPYAEGLRLKDPASILLCKRLSNDGNTKLLFSRSRQIPTIPCVCFRMDKGEFCVGAAEDCSIEHGLGD